MSPATSLLPVELLEGMDEIIHLALQEDSAAFDVTSETLIDANQEGEGVFIAKAPGVIAGLPVAGEVFRLVDPWVTFKSLVTDGQRVRKGERLATVQGLLRTLLAGERTALNFLQRLSGVATQTAVYVKAIEGTKARLLDTRKTTPGHRRLEKYAVRAGGGHNHRMGLGDAILVKDNHIAACRAQEMTLTDVVKETLEKARHGMQVEFEVTSPEEAPEAAEPGAKMLLMDNMTPAAMRKAVHLIAGRATTEASGGITLETIRAVAETGVDYISVGALTHSAKALDISLEIES